MIDPCRSSPFLDIVAVEAWDAWFRWRERGGLRDISIEDTWRRVAHTLASVETGGERARWEACFFEAQAFWRLLLDDRVLADAGCGRISWRRGPLRAALNVAAFVPRLRGRRTQLDFAAVAEHAAVAVRALDNAALLARLTAPALQVGVVGIADALALLGLRYASDAGRRQAARFAEALARGCRESSIELAVTRGAPTPAVPVARVCGAGPDPIRDPAHRAHRDGARHPALTAITAQPRLALLANDVADATDPLRGERHVHVIPGATGSRILRSAGYAFNVMRGEATANGVGDDTLAQLGWQPQLAMRAALQPSLDAPITCPLLLVRALDPEAWIEVQRRAGELGLASPTWQTLPGPSFT